ncbi:MAG: HU family DNA-binding protein [Fidelibacterota bacterium]|nr:MAG: HU family DNA-binding protein [Candidatus Neomarinimicrobiota bacterium]
MTEKITFDAFVDKLAARTEVSKRRAHDFLKELAVAIDMGLVRDGKVRIAHFGTFLLHRIGDTTGRNPQTGESIVIPAHNRVLFHPAQALEKKVNREYNHMKATPVRGQGIPPDTQPPSEPEEPTMPVEEQPPAPPGPTRPLPIRTIAIVGAAVVAVVVIALLVFRGGEEEEAAPPTEVVEEEVAPPAPVEEPAIAPTEELVEEPVTVPEPPTLAPREEPPLQAVEGMPAKVHAVKRGDTLWDLAEIYYGRADFWPLIYRANQPLLRNPDLVMVGIDIIIPMLEGSPQALTKEDSTNLAKGYELAYQAYQRLGKPDAEDYLRSSRWYE